MHKRQLSVKPWRVALVGAGKVGTTLGRVLVENGNRIVAVISRSEASARRAGRFLACRRTTTDLETIPRDVHLIYITTPHGEVAKVAVALSQCGQLDFKRLAVCHASGMLTADVLEPLRARGATVFSFHPLQTFPRDFEPRMIVPTARGIYYGVDGVPAALRLAKQFARRLDGKVIVVPPETRVLYHTACVLASNHLTTLMAILERMYGRITGGGTDFFPVFKPIIMATLKNIEATSPAQALSGPIARGGVDTLAEHLAAVKKHAQELLPYYVQLSLETVALAKKKGSISDGQMSALNKLIMTYSLTNSHVLENL
jgi:predicted short-subunit dehydrogenase-like oxidoreductase (DUF2520 family)